MKFEIVFALLFFSLHIMNGQNGSISVQIDKDTLYLDEALNVEFIIENCGGNFELPVFDNFEIIGGPNVSSSLTIINGVKSQKMSYSFQLLPIESGDSEIPGMRINCEGSVIQTETIPIRILSKKELGDKSYNAELHSFKFENKGENTSNSSKKKRVLKKI